MPEHFHNSFVYLSTLTNGYTKIMRFSDKPIHQNQEFEKEESKAGEEMAQTMPRNQFNIRVKSIGISFICSTY